MKRLFALSLICCLGFGLVGCSGDAGGIVGTDEQVSQEEVKMKNDDYMQKMQAGSQQAKEQQGYGGE